MKILKGHSLLIVRTKDKIYKVGLTSNLTREIKDAIKIPSLNIYGGKCYPFIIKIKIENEDLLFAFSPILSIMP